MDCQGHRIGFAVFIALLEIKALSKPPNKRQQVPMGEVGKMAAGQIGSVGRSSSMAVGWGSSNNHCWSRSIAAQRLLIQSASSA
jgi:hypothetical protein